MSAANGTEVCDEVKIASAEHIHQSVTQAAEFLPSQGPITAFTFLNPLAALETTSFDEALRVVPEVFGCQAYLSEDAYRKMLSQGRIVEDDLRDILLDELGYAAHETIAGLLPRVDFRVSLLKNAVQSGDESELHWLLLETDALARFRPEASEGKRSKVISESRHWIAGLPDDSFSKDLRSALRRARKAEGDSEIWEEISLRLIWHYCCNGVRRVPLVLPRTPVSVRHRDLLVGVTQNDPDELVNDVLVRFCSAYLDQGFAQWRLPDRDAGFLNSFCQLFETSGIHQAAWLRPLKEELQRLQRSCSTPAEWIADSLAAMGVAEDETNDFIRATLLGLRGWAGMIWQTEVRPDRVYIPSPSGTLMEFTAVRLLLDKLATRYVASKSICWKQPLTELRTYLREQLPEFVRITNEQYAFRIFQCAQVNGWGPSTLSTLTTTGWKELIQELADFSTHERQRIFHIAFERRYARSAMDAVATRVARPPIKPQNPILQVTCCIDAREESFRRHIEEVSSDVQTFGAAGFFGIPMYYRGLGDAHYTALCPIVVMPRFWLVEDPVYSTEETARAKARARRILGTATHRVLEQTHRSLGGAFVSALLGPLATAPLVGYTVFPGLTAQLNTVARHFVEPPQISRLRLERKESAAPGPEKDGIGFTVAEMAALGGKLLRDIGLIKDFAPIVLFLGHGSACLNNPHKSAYHCGACSGGAGGPNARAAAAMLNDPRVRKLLAVQGLEIPDETHFLGGQHNTATDEITFYDMELLPSWHVHRIQEIRDILSRACERNAQERCRRFESAALDIAEEDALLHVQDRAQNLSETRPEYGNCTNSLCIVARRERLRGLFLDRRSFLMSYDPTQDDAESSVLMGTLSAVVPVCEGINLLYTFSAMDRQGFGSGSKLPHNATSMLGVMDGAASDLRTGLPWQGVDIHEPMRLLFIIETTPEAMLSIMARNPTIDRICRGGWVQLAVLDPHSPTIMYFSGGRFVKHIPHTQHLPTVERSKDWSCGSRDNLPFAIVESPAVGSHAD
ncbi:MAG: putative inorganic carbon transporter subunit DabA [Planctomycetaceae bacterium]